MAHHKKPLYSYIYFVQLVNGHHTLVKIGRSNDPIRRIKALRTTAPFGLFVLGVFPVENAVTSEAAIHNMFSALRINKKNEWFRLTIPLLLYINAVSNPSMTKQVREAVRIK